MILLDSDLHEIGSAKADIDIEVGTSEASTNDFEFKRNGLMDITPGGFYIPGTEIGGKIEYFGDKTDQKATTFKGFSWRGLLSQDIMMPPAGEDYLIVSGEANSILSSLLSNVLGGFFVVPNTDSGLNIASYQFPLYVNYLDGIEVMLESFDYRLQIKAQKVASGQPIQVMVEAVAAEVVAGTYNQDNGIPMSFVVNNMGINHLICGGSGELQNRMIRHLYIDADGNISQTQYYTGFQERTSFYNYSSAESEDDLIDNGTKRLLEIASNKTLKMKAPDNNNLNVGDIVQGTFPDGTVIRSPIVQKVFKISGGLLNVEYKIKGEE